jgi:hypothetical protein
MRETTDMRGDVTLELADAEGCVVLRRDHRNRIVKSGRRLVAELFGGVASGTPPAKVTHIGIGTNAKDPSDDDIALGAERARNPITAVSYTDFEERPAGATEPVKRTRASLTTVFDFDQANDTAPLREAGVFTAGSGGVMYNRVAFEPVTKTNAFKLTVLWDVVF